MGIVESNLSGYEKFEGPDPAEWTARGYAVVNVDSRGSWDSQGYLWYVWIRSITSYTLILTKSAGLVGKKGWMDMTPSNGSRSKLGAVKAFVWREILG